MKESVTERLFRLSIHTTPAPIYWMPVGIATVPVFQFSETSEVVVWMGRRYFRYPQSPSQHDRDYFKSADTGHRRRLHRDVWEYFAKRPIPDFNDIHHWDLNTLNNSIANLQCLTRNAHMSITHLGRIHSPDVIRRMKAAQQARIAQITPKQVPCIVCGTQFSTKSPRAKFCSNRCTCHWHYKNRRGSRYGGRLGRKPINRLPDAIREPKNSTSA